MFWYHTPELLHRLNPLLPGECWRCGSLPGSFHTCFGTAHLSSLNGFGSMLIEVLHHRIHFDPVIFFKLNVPPKGLSKSASKLLLHILTVAKCLIAAFWKQRLPSSLTDLHTRMGAVRRMEQITAPSK